MTSRRAPRWLLPAAAGALGLALLVAGGVALSGPDRPAAVVEGQAAPVPPAPSPSASPAASPAPAPVVAAPPAPVPAAKPATAPAAKPPLMVQDAQLRSAASPELDVVSVLGPPPGPQADRRPERIAAPADRYAFLVGITDYRAPTKDTIGSARDVTFMRDALLAAGWLPGNVRVVTDSRATGAAVREGMAWLAAKGQPGTFSLFHYSGHVKQKGGTREALWPYDRAFIDDTAVTKLLSRVQGRLWVDIAGCEAGSFIDGLPSDRVLVTASSKQTEKSYEFPPWGMSVWTGLVFDLGLRQGRADADADGRTTIGETLRWSTYYSQSITLGQRPYGKQTPQVAGAGDLGWTLADPPA